MRVSRSQLTVGRTARYFEIGEREAKDVWLVLHGYGQLAADFVRSFESVSGGRRILAPEGLSRFYTRGGLAVGASWMTREDRLSEIEDYVTYLDAVLTDAAARPETVCVLGFSQGAHTACRWASRQRGLRGLVIWGSALPEDLDEQAFAAALRGAHVTLAGGDEDRLLETSALERDLERLQSMGLPATYVRFHGGHELPADVLQDIVSAVPPPESSGSPS